MNRTIEAHRFTVGNRSYYAQPTQGSAGPNTGVYVYPADLKGRGMVFQSVDAFDSWRDERSQTTLKF